MSVSSSPTPLGSSPQFSASSNSLSPRIKHPTVPKIVLPKTLNEVLLVECFKHVQNLVEVKDRKQYFKSHKSCFVGKDLVTAIFNSFVFENRKQALRFGRLFEDKGFLVHIAHQYRLKDNNYLYRFNDIDRAAVLLFSSVLSSVAQQDTNHSNLSTSPPASENSSKPIEQVMEEIPLDTATKIHATIVAKEKLKQLNRNIGNRKSMSAQEFEKFKSIEELVEDQNWSPSPTPSSPNPLTEASEKEEQLDLPFRNIGEVISVPPEESVKLVKRHPRLLIEKLKKVDSSNSFPNMSSPFHDSTISETIKTNLEGSIHKRASSKVPDLQKLLLSDLLESAPTSLPYKSTIETLRQETDDDEEEEETDSSEEFSSTPTSLIDPSPLENAQRERSYSLPTASFASQNRRDSFNSSSTYPLLPKSEDIRLDVLLKDPYGRYLLKKFAKAEFADENIIFYEEVQKFRLLASNEDRKDIAQQIYDLFIPLNSVFNLNLSHPCKSDVVAKLHTGNVDTFDSALSDCVSSMIDTWDRFKLSEDFKIWKQSLQDVSKSWKSKLRASIRVQTATFGSE